jgi:hypothetical protein
MQEFDYSCFASKDKSAPRAGHVCARTHDLPAPDKVDTTLVVLCSGRRCLVSKKRRLDSSQYKLEAVRLYPQGAEAGGRLAVVSRELEVARRENTP